MLLNRVISQRSKDAFRVTDFRQTLAIASNGSFYYFYDFCGSAQFKVDGGTIRICLYLTTFVLWLLQRKYVTKSTRTDLYQYS